MDSYIKTKIVGVTYKNEDGTRRQEIISELLPSESLKLVDMATPEYPEAIGVFDLADQQCGFLNKSLATALREQHPNFQDFSVQVLDITGGDGRSYGCNIEITTDDSYVCQVTVHTNKRISIKTPLVSLDSDSDETIAQQDKVLLNLSSDEELYLFAENDSAQIQVRTLSDECCGYLPAFACEQIRKCDYSLEEYTVHIIETRSNPAPYGRVIVAPGLNPFARKQATDPVETQIPTDENTLKDSPQIEASNTTSDLAPNKRSAGCLLSVLAIITGTITLISLFL